MLVGRGTEAIAEDGGLRPLLLQTLMGCDDLLTIMNVPTEPLLHMAMRPVHRAARLNGASNCDEFRIFLM